MLLLSRHYYFYSNMTLLALCFKFLVWTLKSSWFYIDTRMLKSNLKVSPLWRLENFPQIIRMEMILKLKTVPRKMFRSKSPSNFFLWDWILNAVTWRGQIQALQFDPIYRIKVKLLCFCRDLGYVGSFF